jgi:MFS transporter, SHS family, sialic acid transporter
MSEKKPLSRGQWLVLAAAFLGWMFDGMELGLFPMVSRACLQDLLPQSLEGDVAAWNGRILACFLMGAAVGGVAFGWLGDKIGRVRAMMCSILTYSIFMGLGYFAQQPWQLGALLFVSALGMGGQWSLGVALVMESWPEKARPMLSGIIGAASNFGFLLIAAVALCFSVTPDSWRWMMLVGASPAVLAMMIVAFVPESERWKESSKKGGGSPLIEIFKPALVGKTLLAIVLAGVPLIGTWAAISGWLPVWADKMAGSAAPHAKAVTQIGMAIGAIIGCMIAPLVGGKIGRRPAYFGLCALSLICCQIIFRVFHQYDLNYVLMASLTCAVTAGFYGWLPLYLPELFPTRVRATGQGLSFNFGRFLAAIGAVNMGMLVGALGGDATKGDYGPAGAVITFVYIIGMVVILFAPETKGKPLPE